MIDSSIQEKIYAQLEEKKLAGYFRFRVVLLHKTHKQIWEVKVYAHKKRNPSVEILKVNSGDELRAREIFSSLQNWCSRSLSAPLVRLHASVAEHKKGLS